MKIKVTNPDCNNNPTNNRRFTEFTEMTTKHTPTPRTAFEYESVKIVYVKADISEERKNGIGPYKIEYARWYKNRHDYTGKDIVLIDLNGEICQ